MRVFLFSLLLMSLSVHAAPKSCASLLQISIHRLHNLELMAARDVRFFNEKTNSERSILVAELRSVLSQGESTLRQPHINDDYARQLERTLAAWRESKLFAKLAQALDPSALQADGRPFETLSADVVADLALIKTRLRLIQAQIVRQNQTDTNRGLRELRVELDILLEEFSQLRTRLNLKTDDLERVDRTLARMDDLLLDNLEFQEIVRHQNDERNGEDLRAQLRAHAERLRVVAWYLRHRGLTSADAGSL